MSKKQKEIGVFGRAGTIMKDKVLNNFWTKILSVILAIIIWLLVTNVDNPYITKTYTDIPVTVLNEDALLKKNKTWDIIEGDKVTVTLKAKRSIMDKLSRSDLQATADLSKLSITNAVPINISVLKYEEEIKEKSLGKVDTLKVTLENIETQQFPITIETVGEVSEGYAIGTKIPTPNIVEVSGPESLIKRINQVKATINVQGISSSKTTSVEFGYYNYDGDKLDASRLSSNVKKVDVSINLLKTKTVDLEVETTGKTEQGYQIESILLEPKTIVVAGEQEQLSGLTSVLISDLSIEGLTEDTEENIDITEYLPEGVKLAQESPDVRVKIQVIPLDSKRIKIPVTKIEVLNVGNEFNYNFDDTDIEVLIRGDAESIEDLTIEDLKPQIDLKGLKAGHRKVKLKLQELSVGYYEKVPIVKVVLKEKES